MEELPGRLGVGGETMSSRSVESNSKTNPRRHESVTLVVVTYNEAEILPDLLASLPEALADVDEWELVIADNDSHDRSPEVAEELMPGVTVVRTGHNGGYSWGINHGVAAARPSDAILILNPDIRLHAGSVRTLLEALDEPGVGIAVPRLLEPDGTMLKSLRREPSVLRTLGEAVLGGDRSGRFAAFGEVIQDDAPYRTKSTADWASGAAMMISRDCWDAVGPWDESFFLYAEETEFSLRCRDRGWKLLYVPEAEAVHLAGPSHENSMLWSILVVNKYRLFKRRHGTVRSAAYWTVLALNEGLRGLAGREVHKAGFKALVFPSTRPEQVKRSG
jgi:GT2 family glycosyltransferase